MPAVVVHPPADANVPPMMDNTVMNYTADDSGDLIERVEN